MRAECDFGPLPSCNRLIRSDVVEEKDKAGSYSLVFHTRSLTHALDRLTLGQDLRSSAMLQAPSALSLHGVVFDLLHPPRRGLHSVVLSATCSSVTARRK